MNYYKKHLIGSLIVFCVCNFNSYADTIIDTYTNEDKQVLNEYLLNDVEKHIEDIPIKNYIIHRIENGKTSKDIFNGYSLINKLSIEQRKYFDNFLIDFWMTYSKKNPSFQTEVREGTLAGLLYTIGITRTDKSLEFLQTLMYPMEKWPKAVLECFEYNNDKLDLIQKMRKSAYGALLQPQDDIGSTLLPQIEKIIIGFEETDPMKIPFLENLQVWKRIYEKSGIRHSLYENATK